MNNFFIKTISKSVDNRSHPLPTSWKLRSNQTITSRVNSFGRIKNSVTDKVAIKNSVLEVISHAEDMLILCSFLLADDTVEQALLEAEKRGVRVYCLIAAETRLDREDPEGEFDKKVLAQHKAMLRKLAGKVMFRTSSDFHAKVVLADPFSKSRCGVLLTANITTDAMTRNEELLTELEDAEIRETAAYLKWALWEAAEHEIIESGEFQAVKPQGCALHPKEGFPIIATTKNCRQILKKTLDMIRRAKSEILVSCFSWDHDHEVVQALIDKAASGTKVTILARIRPTSMVALEALSKAGAKVLGFKWLHAKVLAIDGLEAILMSANLQRHGLDEGFELGIILKDDRLEDLLQTIQVWKERAQWELSTDLKVGDVLGKVQIWDGKSVHENEVKTNLDFNLGEIIAFSADDLHVPVPSLPVSGKIPHLAHELNSHWKVKAPSLEKGAKQEFAKTFVKEEAKVEGNKQKTKPVPFDPPVFKESNGRRVTAITSVHQMEQAKRLKAQLKLAAIVLESSI